MALRGQVIAGLHDVDGGAGGDLVYVLLELLRGSWHEGEGPVVDRDDVPHAEEAGGVGGLVGTHHHLVADGQEGDVRAVELPDQLHVAEDSGVPGVVDPEAALELYDVTHRLAGVDHGAVVQGDGRGVEGVGRGYLDPTCPDGAALLYGHRVLDALMLEI